MAFVARGSTPACFQSLFLWVERFDLNRKGESEFEQTFYLKLHLPFFLDLFIGLWLSDCKRLCTSINKTRQKFNNHSNNAKMYVHHKFENKNSGTDNIFFRMTSMIGKKILINSATVGYSHNIPSYYIRQGLNIKRSRERLDAFSKSSTLLQRRNTVYVRWNNLLDRWTHKPRGTNAGAIGFSFLHPPSSRFRHPSLVEAGLSCCDFFWKTCMYKYSFSISSSLFNDESAPPGLFIVR